MGVLLFHERTAEIEKYRIKRRLSKSARMGEIGPNRIEIP